MSEYEYTPLTKMDTSVDVISGLGNRPNVDNGLDGPALRAKFDESANDIKNFLNGYTDGGTPVPGLIDELDGKLEALETTVDGLVAGTVTDGSVYTAAIQDLAVTSAKISESAVTSGKISNAAVTSNKLDSKAVTTAKIADGAVDTLQLADTAVTHGKLGANAVEAGNIKNGEVTTDKLNDGAVTIPKTTGIQKAHSTIEYVTLTANGWSSKKQTVSAAGVTASNLVLTSPWVEDNDQSTASTNNWLRCRDCGIRCIGQGADTLTFECETVPTSACWIAVAIFD